MNHHGKTQVIVPAGSEVTAEKRPPILCHLSTPHPRPPPPPPSPSQAVIRNHNLMPHCQTVSTFILRGRRNDLLVGLRLQLPHPTVS